MAHQTFSHDIVKELHNGDSTIRVIVEQLGINSGCEKLSEEQKKTKNKRYIFKGRWQHAVPSSKFVVCFSHLHLGPAFSPTCR